MIVWRGAGVVVFLLGMLAFLGVALVFDGPTKGELWPWGAAAALVGLITLPLGFVLNKGKPSERTHTFMWIPMQYWGGLLLLGGLGAVGAHFAMGGVAADGPPCDEVGEILAECPQVGPMSGMITGLCRQSPEPAQRACLACLRDAGDSCDIASCGACQFRPAGPR